MVDRDKLNQFIGKMLCDLGGAFSVPMVRTGDKLGLYKALDEKGPMTASELAKETGIAGRYSREWLCHQRLQDISTTTLSRASSPCRLSKQWCSRTATVLSISRVHSEPQSP
jgi:hypothetical protein